VLNYPMPGSEASDVLENISKDSGCERTIAMLTADNCNATIAACREAGIAAYVIKPVREAELLSAIRRVLRMVSESKFVSGARSSTEAGGRKLRVLLAEDNVINQKLAISLLERKGHSVILADNGRKTVALYRNETFDLILMDVQMPEMDGIEATHAIRQIEAGTHMHIPIIAMTAYSMKGDCERCLIAGMDGYLPKPVKIAELFALIESLVMTVTQHS